MWIRCLKGIEGYGLCFHASHSRTLSSRRQCVFPKGDFLPPPPTLFTGLSISSVKGQEGRIREVKIFLCKVVTARGGESWPHRIYSVCCWLLRLFRFSQQRGCVGLGGHVHPVLAAALTVSTQYRVSSTHHQYITPLLVGLAHLCQKYLEQCSLTTFFSRFLAPSHVDTGIAEPFSCPQITTEWFGSLGAWG